MDSVRLRLRSDVNVGTCLSGGLDSSSIAALANKFSSGRFIAIHAKSSQSNNDESIYAQTVADKCDLNLHIIEPSYAEFSNSIEDVIYTQEEPFGSPSIVMQYFVMKKAKEIGCTVLLDGQGGDETLLGYERYYPAYLISLGCFGFIKGLISSSNNSKLSIKQLVQYFIYFTKYKIRFKRLKKACSFIKNEYLDVIDISCLKQSTKAYLNIHDLQKLEICKLQMPHLLRYEDKNSMKFSIETRLPFIDYRVLETALSINSSYKIREGWTKYVLRKSVDNILPKNIVWRKNKLGFEAPTKSWLSEFDEEMKATIIKSKVLKEFCQSLELKGMSDKLKWRLFNIAKWEEVYDVKI